MGNQASTPVPSYEDRIYAYYQPLVRKAFQASFSKESILAIEKRLHVFRSSEFPIPPGLIRHEMILAFGACREEFEEDLQRDYSEYYKTAEEEERDDLGMEFKKESVEDISREICSTPSCIICSETLIDLKTAMEQICWGPIFKEVAKLGSAQMPIHELWSEKLHIPWPHAAETIRHIEHAYYRLFCCAYKYTYRNKYGVGDGCVQAVRLHCRHFFGMKCIDIWAKQNGRCPICREDLLTPIPTSLQTHFKRVDLSTNPRFLFFRGLISHKQFYLINCILRMDQAEGTTGGLLRWYIWHLEETFEQSESTNVGSRELSLILRTYLEFKRPGGKRNRSVPAEDSRTRHCSKSLKNLK